MFLMLFALVQPKSAFYVTPIFSGTGTQCTQLNASYLYCPDAIPISVRVAISADYSPYLGNFLVYPIDFANVSIPTNIYGTQCQISSSATETCYFTLNPINLLEGNATIKKQIGFNLISNAYHQMQHQYFVNITIIHYLDNFELNVYQLYQKVTSESANMSSAYAYFCTQSNICSNTIVSGLSKISNSISIAKNQINESKLNSSYSNLSAANYSINAFSPKFTAYIGQAYQIFKVVNSSRAILSNATAELNSNSAKLVNCTFGNGTKYYTYLNNSLRNLKAYAPMWNQSLANMYLNLSRGFSKNETDYINSCSARLHGNIFATPLPQIKAQSFYWIVPLLAVILIVTYAALRFNEMRVVREIRKPSMKAAFEESPLAAEPGASKLVTEKDEKSTGATDTTPPHEEHKPEPKPLPKKPSKKEGEDKAEKKEGSAQENEEHKVLDGEGFSGKIEENPTPPVPLEKYFYDWFDSEMSKPKKD